MNSNELDMEQRYQAELERAVALSLETHELEKISAKQRQIAPEMARDPKCLEEYRAYLKRRVACGTGSIVGGGPASASGAGGPVRRHSDCRSPATLQATAAAQSAAINNNRITAGPATATLSRDEADLISFNALPKPPDPKEEARNNLKELVTQMHR